MRKNKLTKRNFKRKVMKCLGLVILVMNMTNKVTKNPLKFVLTCETTLHLLLHQEKCWMSTTFKGYSWNNN